MDNSKLYIVECAIYKNGAFIDTETHQIIATGKEDAVKKSAKVKRAITLYYATRYMGEPNNATAKWQTIIKSITEKGN